MMNGEQHAWAQVSGRSLWFLLFSGLATRVPWLAYGDPNHTHATRHVRARPVVPAVHAERRDQIPLATPPRALASN